MSSQEKAPVIPSPFQGEGGPKDRMRVRSRSVRDRSMVNRARALRRRQTPAESTLWRLLRDRRLSGHKFRRQYPIGPFVLDFYCPEAHLAIELDGGGHADERQARRDDIREIELKNSGIHLLRVWNAELMKNEEAVLTMLVTFLSHSGKSKTGKMTHP